MAKLLVFIQTLAACVTAASLTLVTSFFIVMHDRVILDYLEQAICAGASNAFECDFNAQVDRLDLLHGTVFLTDVIVVPAGGRAKTPAHRNWFWACDSISVTVNWAKLFFNNQAVLSISCGVMQLDTQYVDGKIAITEHIKAFMREKVTAIPIIPEKLHIQKAHIGLHINDQKVFECCIRGAVDLIDNQQHIGLTIIQNQFAYHDNVYARDVKISVKRVVDKITQQSSSALRGTLQIRNVFDGSWVDAIISGELSGDKTSLQARAGALCIKTDLKSTATVALDTLCFNLQYHLEKDHVAVTLSDDNLHALQAQMYYAGHYAVQGDTAFFNALLQKNILPPEYQARCSAYGDLLHYKAPFVIKGMHTPGSLQHDIDFSGLHIRVPYTYNFLRTCRSTLCYAYNKPYLILRDTLLQTDRGTLACGTSTLTFDDQHTLRHAHVPLMIQDFFINSAKDFFAELSGACIIDYQKEARSKIAGICTIKKCHIRNNPFSGNVGNDIVAATLNPFEGHPLAQATDLNLIVNSYEPVEIKTAFLQARAQVKLQVLGTIAEPQLFGHIELLQGTLQFPYKPVEIRYGKIFFVDNQRDDPAIELCASAVIKNYAITLIVDGTARSPIITLQSTPHLQEEQIIGLLFGGSPDSSLALVMPLSSMGTLEKLIVGSSSEFEQEGELSSWLGSLQNVKIIPRFSDQTSRGGLRAALAIEVNENISALIQQNFSLSEDTLIEVAYKPLDELTIRGIRDERGDFGGEVEARFTW